MRLTQMLTLSKEGFFEVLADFVRWEVESATGIPVSRVELEQGYCYRKRMKTMLGSIADVDVEIVELGLNDRYVVRFTSGAGVNQISYSVTEHSRGRITVSYQEHFEGARGSISWSYRVMGALMWLFGRRRICRMLHQMELSAENRPSPTRRPHPAI